MADLRIITAIPLVSLVIRPIEEMERYQEVVKKLPDQERSLVSSLITSAYIRGLAKENKLPPAAAPIIAFAILLVALGDLRLDSLASDLAQSSDISPEIAQRLATDIKQELFSERPQSSSQPPATPMPSSSPVAGPVQKSPNVLDLNKEQGPPPPPPIPK